MKRPRNILITKINGPLIPDALRIRASTAPTGTTIITTTQAVVQAMTGSGLADQFTHYKKFEFIKLTALTEKIKSDPVTYHKTYYAYGKAPLSNADQKKLEDGKVIDQRFAPYAQAFLETYLKAADLGKAQALKKHADADPISKNRATNHFIFFLLFIANQSSLMRCILKSHFYHTASTLYDAVPAPGLLTFDNLKYIARHYGIGEILEF
ncbi:MAG: hypothetical protein Q9161_008593 [Pseudevernia consocians]